MKQRDLLELVGLAALWGASFLFVRMGAGEFGPVALAALRVTGAALVLMPLLALRGQLGALRMHWRPILVVGITNSVLPFLLFAYAALSITAGLAAIFNAASPLFGALIAWAWLKDRLTTAHVGPANAIAVTFLIPAFAVLWGWLFLSEAVTPAMLAGCAVILVGTALATGLLKPRGVARA